MPSGRRSRRRKRNRRIDSMPAPLIALEQISKRFGAIVVANRIDLALAPGEALGIIGPNGAGKTTLFGMISGTLAPDGGRVVYAGRDITHLPPAQRCALGIGRSFQIPQPFSGMSVFENLVVAAAFGGGRRERDAYESCMAILTRCGLAGKANRLAGSLTLLDRKRLELARTLASDPKVLLLDEVAGGLTEHECRDLIALIGEIRRSGVSIVWIEHVVHALLASVDRLLVLHNGAFIAVRELDAGYGDFQALFGVSIDVECGEAVAVIGANGAGKSTLLKSIAGLVRARRDAITFAGEAIGGKPAYDVAARGIALVPEGRALFASLTVEENLRIGGQLGRPGPWNLQQVYELFPVLRERRNLPSAALSGGQQQMAALGRALMVNPQLLLCDEISLGLAPIVVREIYARLPAVLAAGTAVVIVEQDVVQALTAAARVYCLQEGRVALAGRAIDLTREAIAAAYFGV